MKDLKDISEAEWTGLVLPGGYRGMKEWNKS